MAKQVEVIPRLLLDAHDAAQALSICERKLWELTNKGDLPCVRIGRRVLYDPRALTAWIDEQMQGGGVPADEIGAGDEK